MKKNINLIITFLTIFASIFLFTNHALALTGTVNVNDALYIRKSPSSNADLVTSLYNNSTVTILDKSAGTGNGCSNAWYRISYGSYTGYACSTYINLNDDEREYTSSDDSYNKSNYDTPHGYDGSIMCYEDDGDLSLRKTVGGSFTGEKVSCGELVNINSTQESTNSCKYYYNITTKGGKTGWVCGYYVNTTKLTPTADAYYKNNGGLDSYYNTLKTAGFPESYLPYLAEIHARYPKWNFVAESINLNFSTIVSKESGNGTSLLEGSAFGQGYRSLNSHTYSILKDTFTTYPTEAGWYNASEEAIAYFMDPRNYLNYRYIFAFETLNYSDYQNSSVVSSILSGQTFWNSVYEYYNKENAIQDSTKNVSTDVVKASSEVGISAVHVATRIKQEISGISTTDPRLGGSFTSGGTTYSGYYNFFNIGVYGNNKIVNGMNYAKSQSWNTPYKGLRGGAAFIYNDYISVNQDTLYYEKFDVSRKNSDYTHQYMQNLAAPIQEGGAKYTGYISTLASYLDNAITFVIPVYNNMPAYVVTAPKTGNPNNYLKDLKVDGTTVSQFSYDTYNYNVSLASGVTSVKIDATKINANATVSGTGTIAIKSNNQTNTITVTSQNGKVRKYNINFTRKESTPTTVANAMNNSGFKYNDNYLFGIDPGTNVSEFIGNITSYNDSVSISITSSSGTVKTKDSFRTGDKVTVTAGDGEKTYTVAIYGDINGDGLIDKNDLLYVQSKVLGYTELDTLKTEVADINKDGLVDKNDLLYFQSHVLGYTSIKQG